MDNLIKKRDTKLLLIIKRLFNDITPMYCESTGNLICLSNKIIFVSKNAEDVYLSFNVQASPKLILMVFKTLIENDFVVIPEEDFVWDKNSNDMIFVSDIENINNIMVH